MNTKLLRKIQRHIRAHPRRFDMQKCTPGTDPGCGCIVHFAQVFGGLRFSSKSAVVGAGALRCSNDAMFRLAFLIEWPEKFQALYKHNRAKAGIARIDHFIKTGGRE